MGAFGASVLMIGAVVGAFATAGASTTGVEGSTAAISADFCGEYFTNHTTPPAIVRRKKMVKKTPEALDLGCVVVITTGRAGKGARATGGLGGAAVGLAVGRRTVGALGG